MSGCDGDAISARACRFIGRMKAKRWSDFGLHVWLQWGCYLSVYELLCACSNVSAVVDRVGHRFC